MSLQNGNKKSRAGYCRVKLFTIKSTSYLNPQEKNTSMLTKQSSPEHARTIPQFRPQE